MTLLCDFKKNIEGEIAVCVTDHEVLANFSCAITIISMARSISSPPTPPPPAFVEHLSFDFKIVANAPWLGQLKRKNAPRLGF